MSIVAIRRNPSEWRNRLGEVIAMHIDDRVLGEEDGKLRIDAPAMNLVGRAHGAGWYWRGSDQVSIDRTGWDEAKPTS